MKIYKKYDSLDVKRRIQSTPLSTVNKIELNSNEQSQ